MKNLFKKEVLFYYLKSIAQHFCFLGVVLKKEVNNHFLFESTSSFLDFNSFISSLNRS
jgi:hypothetical protein